MLDKVACPTFQLQIADVVIERISISMVNEHSLWDRTVMSFPDARRIQPPRVWFGGFDERAFTACALRRANPDSADRYFVGRDIAFLKLTGRAQVNPVHPFVPRRMTRAKGARIRFCANGKLIADRPFSDNDVRTSLTTGFGAFSGTWINFIRQATRQTYEGDSGFFHLEMITTITMRINGSGTSVSMIIPLKAKDRVKLTDTARAEVWKYGDVGTRFGTVIRIDGWPVVQWQDRDSESWVPREDLEVVSE